MIYPGSQSGTAAQSLQAAGNPSAGRIAAATGVALLVAAVVLVTAVLPAEYGIDLVGTGKLLGLVQLADARPGVLTAQPGEYRVDKIEFVLGPFESVEYKYRIEQGGSMLFSWQSTGQVVAELHSEPDGAPKGYAETFDKQQGTAQHGTYTAPFSGIHGWYWENVDKKDVRIILTTAGFYSKALEFSGGGTFDHEVRDLRGNPVQPASK
jgi:hypothetical protein